MNSSLKQRDVARIDRPEIRQGMSDAHRVRPLVEPGNWAATDPFLLLMEDWFPRGVFDRHPHRGIETVTYVLNGSLEHYDNHGNTGTIREGDAEWLTAGRGLMHLEQPAAGEQVHLLQLWVNLPRKDKLVPAHFQDLKGAVMPVRIEPGVEVRIFSGSSGSLTAPTRNHAPVTMLELRLEPGAHLEQELPAGYNAFIVVLEGSAKLGATAAEVKAGQVAWLTPSDTESAVAVTGGKQALRAMLFAGQPLREPVAARGPFVMNTEEELADGFAEFRRTGENFGKIALDI